MQLHHLDQGTWSQFRERFLSRYFSKVQKYQLRMKFECLMQGTSSVEKYRQEFNNLSRYAPDLVSTEKFACLRFGAGLDIKMRLRLAGREYATIGTLAGAATTYEELLNEQKRMEATTMKSHTRNNSEDVEKEKNGGDGKNSGSKRTSDMISFTSQGQSKSASPDKSVKSNGCFNCGQQDHIARNCIDILRCNFCKEEGHKISSCPQAVCYKCGIKGHTNTFCPINTTSISGIPTTSVASSSHTIAGRGRGQPNARTFNQSQRSRGR